MNEKLNKKIPIKYLYTALYSLPIILFIISASALNFLGDYNFKLLIILFSILVVTEGIIWILIKLSQKFHASKKTFLYICELLLIPIIILYRMPWLMQHINTKLLLTSF